MTNFEFYRKEILETGIGVFRNKWYSCYAREDMEYTEWLYAEHIEPIMLEQWEYDFLINFDTEYPFGVYPMLRNLKAKGYFHCVTDTKMTVGPDRVRPAQRAARGVRR